MRATSVVVTSPLPVEVASYALASEVRSYGSAILGGLRLGSGARIVIGKVEGDYVHLQARRPGINNPWRPNLTGHLVPMAGGSQLIGQLRRQTFIKAFSALWLGIDVFLFFGGLFGIVSELIRGYPSKSLPYVVVIGVTFGFAAFYATMAALCIRMSNKDEAFLLQWIAERLHAIQ